MNVALATRADGLLKDFNEGGVLSVADVQVARRLGTLTGESDAGALLAAALTVRSTRLGSVVVDLADAAATIAPDADEEAPAEAPAELPWPELDGWVEACSRSPLVAAAPAGAPLRMVGTRLWLDRYWQQEAQVADELLRRSQDRPDDISRDTLHAALDELFGDADDSDQRAAVAIAALSRVSVIAGGPGTGKTTTLARLIAVLLRSSPHVRVALAAPTGKAAARLEEAVHSAREPLTPNDRRALSRLSASTLHRLLGRRPGVHSRFKYDRENRLPFDVVIVDESSMLPLTMMARLLEALRPATRLVLVGDPDQLASVEAGAVLGDLVDTVGTDHTVDTVEPLAASPAAGLSALRESVAMLRTVHRFEAGGAIAQLAQYVRDGHSDDALAFLREQPEGLRFEEVDDERPGVLDVQELVAYERAMIRSAIGGKAAAALDALEGHRLLCAHRAGPRGVRHWSDAVERALAAEPDFAPRADGRYPGQPLLVTSNDYENGLYNGDTGVVVRQGDDLVAAFRRAGAPEFVPLVRLSAVRPLHAMTVHRAQGSQFDQVTVLLPLANSPLATRQTLYTAITRAVRRVRLVGSADSVLTCIERRAARATGLRDRLEGRF